MSLHKGITVQPSRFAALNIDSDSDSDTSGNEWFEVVSGKATSKTNKGGSSDVQQQHKDGPSGGKPLSKSAKKRARRKRNQQSSSSEVILTWSTAQLHIVQLSL